MPTLVVAGGGTGGHVLAGVAIADAWMEAHREHSPRAVFVGARGGIEERLVSRYNYPLELLEIGSLNRVSLKRRVTTLVQLPISLLKSTRILLREKPQAVIGVGGYASGPLVLMARLIGWTWGARVAILEQNAVPGMTNRVLSKFAEQVFSAFPGIENQFPGKKVVVTGNPIRNSIHPFQPASRDPFVIFVFGGSQGAQGINSLVIEALPFLEDLKSRIRFVHQTGEKDHARVAGAYERTGFLARVEKFIHEMPEAYASASLLICRAGSSTLAEVAAAKRASILIPFPQAADNHQERNARIFVDRGAAFLLKQADSSGEQLARIVREMVAEPHRLTTMERSVAEFYRPEAAKEVVRLLS